MARRGIVIGFGLFLGGHMFGWLKRHAHPKPPAIVEAEDASTAQDTGYTWRLTPDKLDLGGQPDPLDDDQVITAAWIPTGVREIQNEYPMGLHIVYEWRDSHLKGSPFEGDIGRHFVVDHVDRYFLIHMAMSCDTSVNALVRTYAAAIRRVDETLVWPDQLSREKAILLATAIHRKEYGRDDLREGDRVLLLVPNIHYVGQETPAGVFVG